MVWHWDDPRSWIDQIRDDPDLLHVEVFPHELAESDREALESILRGESVEDWERRQGLLWQPLADTEEAE
jgi:hypothetical protein